jgi:hypothetical protein
MAAITGTQWPLVNLGIGGTAVGAYPIDSQLATLPKDIAPLFIIDLGVNNFAIPGVVPSHDGFVAAYLTILDKIKAAYPFAQAYLSFPWRSTQLPNWPDMNTACATLRSYIQDVIAARSDWVHAGPDQNVWLANGDNGATRTTDGVHFSSDGQAESVRQWKLIFGH